MRKVSVFLITLILAALLLAACGGEETSTNVPATEVPPVTAEATNTSEGTTATVTAEGTDMTTTPGVPVTGEESPARVSNMLDYDVWNQDGEQIGEVDDMVLDMDNTMISYVVVGTGGFLDLGEKEVLVPWDMLELQTGAENANIGDQNAFVFTGEQDLFNNAPDIDIDTALPDIGTPAVDWDVDIRDYWESGVAPGAGTTTTPAAEATASPEANATTAGPAAATQSTDQGQSLGQAEDLQGVILASDLLGSTIQVQGNEQALNNQGQAATTASPEATAGSEATAAPLATATVGIGTGPGATEVMDLTVEDVIVDPQSGEIQYLVVRGGFADGERWIPVPLGFLQWDASTQTFALRVKAAALQNAPVFEGGQFPDLSTEGWDDEFSTFWENPDNAGGTGGGAEATPTP